jgi:DNA polymerase III gamma/tau subunit
MAEKSHLMRNTLVRSALIRGTAPTAWNVQPLQQNFAEAEGGEASETTEQEAGETSTEKPEETSKEETKEPADIDWKAMARKHEAENKKLRPAAAELEKIKERNRSAEEKAQKERDDARAEAAEAKAEASREKAARKYGLSDEDLEFLDGVPADKFDARAKALSERLKKAGTSTAGTSGGEVTGAKSQLPLQDQIAAAQKARDFPLVVALKEKLHHQTTK